MGETFSVETNELPQIQTLLQEPQRWLAGQRCATVGWAAAGASGVARDAVGGFTDALDRFLVAGANALASDIRALDANRAGYERTDLGAATLFGSLR